MPDRTIFFGARTLTLEEYRRKEASLTRPLTDGSMLVKRTSDVSQTGVKSEGDRSTAETAEFIGWFLG